MISLFLLCLTSALAQENITLGIGESRTVNVPGLSRIAVGNGKILKARAVPPSQVLVTGLRAGQSSLHVWGARERDLTVVVVPPDFVDRSTAGAMGGVVRASLEFLEIDSSVSRSLGVRWPDAIHFSAAGSAGGQISGLNYSAAFSSARGWIQQMIRDGWAKLLATPELYVRMGEEAIFSSGGELPVASSSENYGRSVKHVEWKPYGLSVKVRPQSVDNLNIFSDLDIEISEVDASRALEGVPALSKRHLQTKMESRVGETVVLSGLLRQAASSERQALPVLGDIPLLGDLLFASRNQVHDETEIFMAVTFSISSREQQEGKREGIHSRFSKLGGKE